MYASLRQHLGARLSTKENRTEPKMPLSPGFRCALSHVNYLQTPNGSQTTTTQSTVLRLVRCKACPLRWQLFNFFNDMDQMKEKCAQGGKG